MINELLWVALLVLNFSLILFSFSRWGKIGLLSWIPITIILANIQVTKSIDIFGMQATLGNITYATGFLATDMLSEFYGKEEAKKGVYLGFFTLLATISIMQLALLFEPNVNDFAQSSLLTIFGFLPRIALGSLLAYAFSQFHDVYAYEFWKNKKPSKLWIRNNFSTLISQIIDTLIFVLIAFYGVFELKVVFEIALSTYIIKAIVGLLDTPCLYLAREIHKRRMLNKMKEIIS